MGGTVKKILYSISPISFRDSFYIEKWRMFVEGVLAEESTKVKLSEYFVTKEEKKEYLHVILKTLDDIDSDKKVKLLVNLTRSLLNDFISKKDYYRMVNCIRVVLTQDLEFLKENISVEYLTNNPNVDALVQACLVYQDHIPRDNSRDTVKYKFTSLAKLLDKYSLSFGDETKYVYDGQREDLSCTSHQTKIDRVSYREIAAYL